MRKVHLKKASFIVIAIIVAAIICMAILRSKTTEEEHRKIANGGAMLFQEKGCSQCHLTDSRETKIGPGLSGLFERDNLPVSKRPVNKQNVRRQLQDPYQSMPDFSNKLTEEQVEAIIGYLKTL